jgi:sucrose-6-phosphate hydrolase SacC (GH32 family)
MKSTTLRAWLWLTVASSASLNTLAQDDALLIADFEGPDYGAWQVTGEAFGKGPARGTLPNQQEVSGFLGRGLVNSYFNGDGTTGTLTSPEFTIARRYLRFLIGGGNHPGHTCLNLLVEGKVARTATGPNSETLTLQAWDLRELVGKPARLQIVDQHTGGWGHINVDHILQTDEPLRDDRELALARAMSSVQNAAERAVKDPTRPQYHFRPPANWNNDPNGPIFYQGYYHLFYQHNPYGDRWNHMHWGHARSRDLVTWEHLPIALWPSRALGEQHCFSGCAWLDHKGRPMIFYTSIGPREPHLWIALPEDDELIRWEKFGGNPVLTESSPSVKYYDFRDPFVFAHAGRTFMVHGGNLNQAQGGQAVVSLYEAENPELTKWKYRSILFQHPDPKVVNIECPLFFKLGEKFVLITSPHRQCDYFIGAFDPEAGKFTAETQGLADHSSHFYAPNCLADEQGRRVLWGWVRGFKEGRGWNGCMTLPRVLTLEGHRLIQRPAPELVKLRGEGQRATLKLNDTSQVLDKVRGDLLEIIAEFELGTAKTAGVKLRRSADGSRATLVQHDGATLDVAGVNVPLPLGEPARRFKLQVFLDKSVLEVYVNDGRECITRVIEAREDDLDVEWFATGGGATVTSIDAWPLRSIW